MSLFYWNSYAERRNTRAMVDVVNNAMMQDESSLSSMSLSSGDDSTGSVVSSSGNSASTGSDVSSYVSDSSVVSDMFRTTRLALLAISVCSPLR